VCGIHSGLGIRYPYYILLFRCMHVCMSVLLSFLVFAPPPSCDQHVMFKTNLFFVLPTWYKIEKTENTSSSSSSSSSHDHHHSKDTKTHGFLLNGTTALNSITNDMYLHDPSTDTWTTLWLTNNNDNDNATDVGIVLPVARSYSYGVVLPQSGDTKAYLGFGSSLDSQILADW
jgi:hypothetical protein